ncbi:MAG: family 2 glycosyl transferase [Roseibaca calidilacus]|uniref:Family 2 glycosyl transferase n=1 Tax=Roseibaca calidilacus TaxID=1666912 RepID=A0A0P7X1P4_9RHOB|nr:glycosyltransferase [Roseibaca calidilacus]KPP94210.1 MAG: family 2 glycosyl transferase [Roseibaca calidilacus]CUX81370.1 Glycosyltransferase, catalytic subunit of cellulose synthase and poly-beta-1,6-N-acetylglucosamine synthase [Roseibaca calidilacus]
MANAAVQHLVAAPPPRQTQLRVLSGDGPPRKPLGEILREMGALSAAQLMRAIRQQDGRAALLGEILLARGWITQDHLMQALSLQFGTRFLTAADPPPDPRLLDRLGVVRALTLKCLPWHAAGGMTVVASARPAEFERHRPELEAVFGPVVMMLTSEAHLHARILSLRRNRLRLWAETCVAEKESCRMLQNRWFSRVLAALLAGLTLLAVLWPLGVLMALTAVAVFALVLSTLLKLAAAFAALRCGPVDTPLVHDTRQDPIVSVMVPLYREPEVVPRLVNRLARLTWPRELTDILLVVEENDHLTRDALAKQRLPNWMRVILVPDAKLKTKPRALNYAMAFARGDIIGVYDAEDAPEPDQIHRVVAAFALGPKNLACVQGVLDFYNPAVNWLSRCFTIEYATWFRVILPGMQRLGLAVPLGGTTLFFRRDVLTSLGGWDAHNVTEDADLGIRLARHGYVTHLLPTVTFEEANCHVLPWIKQRSRWLKGYAITWLVHMRQPALLWSQLGAWRFFGVQVLFLGTLVQFLLAPLLWSFWLMLLGLGHPLQDTLPGQAFSVLAAVFLLAEATTLALGAIALRARHHAGLWRWLPALHLYFPLAVLAVYKALWELISAPFYWDKTAHGKYAGAREAQVIQA